MTQPPKGPGALPLLLRLSMLRSRQQGGGSLAERGYALAVALIAAFVILLGVGAIASRGQLGFIGQVFQAQNRQARDVAESAIAEFADTLNREENRFLLIANDEGPDWGNVDNRNHCLAFDANQDPIVGRDPGDPTTLPTIGAGVFARFSEGADFRPLRGADTTRQFQVESIDHLNPQRTGPIDRQSLVNAVDRGLIRVTMVGRVDLGNGRVSQARVSREFEVVPKCCKRSYGANAARNWGRDREACEVTGVSQFRVSLSGGVVDGKGQSIEVRDENGDPITQAVCWNGSDGSDPGNILTGSVNPNCTQNLLSIPGKPDGTSFAPAKFDFNPPPYAESTPSDYLSVVTANEPNFVSVSPSVQLSMPSKDSYIYFDDTVDNLRICETNKAGGIENCQPFPTDTSTGKNVCYHRIDEALGSSAPYHEVNCRLRNIDSGGQTIFVDTTRARINFFFDDTSYTGELMGGNGNTNFQRVHCRFGNGGYSIQVYDNLNRCTNNLEWIDAAGNGEDFQQVCTLLDSSSCGLSKSDGSLYKATYFDVSELFNIYSLSAGNFDLRGNANTIGFNLYAPFSSVSIKGGGNADPNFMGRLWVDGFEINGNVSIRVPSGGPSGFQDGLQGVLWDFRARSFTQSSGF